MKWLAELISLILWSLWGRWQKQEAQKAKEQKAIDESGKQALEAAEDAVSDLTGEKPNRSKEPQPIKEGKVPSVEQAQDYFKHRRNRTKP